MFKQVEHIVRDGGVFCSWGLCVFVLSLDLSSSLWYTVERALYFMSYLDLATFVSPLLS